MWNIIYAVVFLASLCFSVLLVPLARRFAIVFNVLDHPSPRKIHTLPTPLTGGIALYFSILATIIAGLTAGRFLPEQFFDYYASISSILPKLTIFLITLGVVVVAGFLDDILHFRPMIKLGFQILCGIVTFLAGIKISFFSSSVAVHLVFTVGWIVLCMNSFNLLDHANGLVAGVAFIAGSIFFFNAALNGQLFISTLLACFLGATLGFLKYNFPSGTIFLGECGSSFLGYFLGCLAIMGTYYRYQVQQSFLPALSPIIIFSLPFFDTLNVIYIRLRNRRPIFQADTNHIFHRLVRLGMNQIQAVGFCYLLTFATGLGAILLRQLNIFAGLVVFLQTFLILMCVAIVESSGRKND
ncbi:MAG: undecaprenyl/decaprenyl-phosphate alpha-N-acetylglucosaminyl 1-phosphate transferase [Candidatus Omnitrophica bacterium]|nr:undecaprenyl/decaprenyl-phosphate alpha-N-acetylglucosaminyl 1-phosphate transferase [Candidatus Omnitrophota bacterium]MCM8828083.1 undecaprenyl/decaprenyl-phosphate alpha-N-acetylglucosaminyl 1-phosphate transferase [Candidatus Omnitrophota bacterium]